MINKVAEKIKDEKEKEDPIEVKLEKYRNITKEALRKVGIKAEEGTEDYDKGESFVRMAKDYYSDADYFEKQGKKLTALAAYSYAHAWLDAGIKAGFLDGKEDDRLFVLP